MRTGLLAPLLALALCGGCAAEREDGATAPDAARTTDSTSPKGEATVQLTVAADRGARCRRPTPAVLGDLAGHAFAGEVTAVQSDRVSLSVGEWYVPTQGPSTVEVSAPPQALRPLLQAIDLRAGERYLIAANERAEVLACGFSTPDTEDGRRLFEQAFR